MADERDVKGGRRGTVGGDPPAEGRGAPVAETEQAVEEGRRRIDVIDDQLTKLLNSRSACAVEIGRLKRRVGMAVYQPEREKWILDRVERNNPGPLDSGAVRRVFERVIDEGRRLERLAGEAEAGEEGGAGTRPRTR
jgi:chorismate mutase